MTTPMTVPEVAARLRCAEWTVRRLAHAGELKASFISGRWLVRPEDLDAFLEEKSNRAPARRRRRRAS